MTTNLDLDRLSRLLARVEALERRAADGPSVTPTIAQDAYGNPGNVVAGELIESAWGNATADRVVHTFPDVAARDTWTAAPDGVYAVTLDTGLLWLRRLGVWIRLAPDQRSVGLAPVDALSPAITVAATLDYGIVDYNRVFVGHLIAQASAVNGDVTGRITLMLNGGHVRQSQSSPLVSTEAMTLTVAASFQVPANTAALIQGGVYLMLGIGAFRIGGDPTFSSLDCVAYAA